MAKELSLENAKIVQLSMRVSQSAKDEFYKILEEGAYETCGLCMDALLERYHNPLKINQENETKVKELTEDVLRLNSELEELKKMYQNQKDISDRKSDELDQLKSTNISQAKRIEQMEDVENGMKGKIMVPVCRMDELCLEYLANRENKRRKRTDITPATFFMYAVREMIINGNKFAIDSVPDSEISKFKKIVSDENR